MAAALAVIVLVSCSGSGDEPVKQDFYVEAVFKLTVSNSATAQSRSAGFLGDDYDRGEGYENYIDIENRNFKFYVFDKDNFFISELEIADIVPVESSVSSKTYSVHSFGYKSEFTGEVKIVVLANWNNYVNANELTPGQSTINDIVRVQYDYDASKTMIGVDNLVPLYGVTNPIKLDYSNKNTAEIGTIHLLRAYAKVEVNLDPSCVFPIEWVKLSRYNTSGYCAPQGVYSKDDYVFGSYDDDYTKLPSVPQNAETVDELPFKKVSNTRWLIYIPEYINVGRPDNERSTIKIKFVGAETDVDVLYFAIYDTTVSPNVPKKHFDILRNTWYSFTVKKNSSPLIQVVPYNEVELGPLFGLFLGKELIPIIEDNGSIIYWYDKETGKYYGPDRITEIEDPYLVVDRVTGWTIIRDLNDKIVAYYDPETGIYYDLDKVTPIAPPTNDY